MRAKRGMHHPKTSKAVLERQKTCDRLLAELEIAGSPTRATPDLPGSAPLLQGLAPWLRRSIDTLVRLDEKVFATHARLTQARQERDTALRRLAHDVAKLRLSIENQYKAPQIERLGFESPTPRSPEPLLRVAGRVAKYLAHPELGDLLGQSWYSQAFDPATHRAPLAQQVETLRQLLHRVDQLTRDLDLARIRRRQAQEEHDILVREARQMVGSMERLSRLARSQARPQPRGQAQTRIRAQTRASQQPTTEHLPKPARAKSRSPDRNVPGRTHPRPIPPSDRYKPRNRLDTAKLPPSPGIPKGSDTKAEGQQSLLWVEALPPGAPKGHDPPAQGKRSAALGRRRPPSRCPKGAR